jgi:hypothetical protein
VSANAAYRPTPLVFERLEPLEQHARLQAFLELLEWTALLA